MNDYIESFSIPIEKKKRKEKTTENICHLLITNTLSGSWQLKKQALISLWHNYNRYTRTALYSKCWTGNKINTLAVNSASRVWKTVQKNVQMCAKCAKKCANVCKMCKNCANVCKVCKQLCKCVQSVQKIVQRCANCANVCKVCKFCKKWCKCV